MHLSPTFSVYIARQFLLWLAIMLFALMGIAFVFDLVELLRRAANKPEATFGLMLQMTLLKLPTTLQVLLHFSVLFASMATYARLTRTSELVVARASGVSVWQFTLPVVVAALSIGLIFVAVVNPLAAATETRFRQMEGRYLDPFQKQVTVAENAIWLRQSVDDQSAIIAAQSFAQEDLTLRNITIFRFAADDVLLDRLEAASARLHDSAWLLHDVTVFDFQNPPQHLDQVRLATNLTRENILNSLAAPQTLSVWSLPAFISVLKKAGFSATRHRLHFQSLLAIPFLLCAVTLISASFSLSPPRRGQTLLLLGCGAMTGFALYFMTDIVNALGSSARIPVFLAVWSPPFLTALLGVILLLHREDG